mmetsp:Transcript_33230/g.78532  ORF Transcript_33230/g.78532 Transcript_33230/m.78532 type:complete len:200 (+) Transcript_33230:343-942(+)
MKDLIHGAGLRGRLHTLSPLALRPVEAVLLARAARPRTLLGELGLRVAMERVGEVGADRAAAPLGTVGQVVLTRLRLAHLAGHRAVGKHEAWVGLALADGGPRGAVVVGVLAGAALPWRGLTSSLADATRRPAARLHECRVVLALAALSPVAAVLRALLVDTAGVGGWYVGDRLLPLLWRLRRNRPGALRVRLLWLRRL